MLCFSFSRVRKAKLAISWYFFVIGTCMGNFAAIIPFVKEQHNLDNGALGGVLAAAVVGAIVALPVVTYCSDRLGCGKSTILGSLSFILLLPLVGLKGNVGVFIMGVFFLGFGAGWTDVSVNGQAVLCEKMTRMPTMGMFHAIAAIGGFVGALIGGILMQHKVSVFHELVFVAFLLLLPEIIFSCWLFSLQEERLINTSLLNTDEQQQYDRLDTTDRDSGNNERGSGYSVNNPIFSTRVSSLDSSPRPTILSTAIYSYSDEDERNSEISNNTPGNVVGQNINTEQRDDILSRTLQNAPLLRDSQQSIGDSSIATNKLSTLNNPQQSRSDAQHNSMDSRQTEWQTYNSIEHMMDYATLWKLCFLCFVAYFAEGSVDDWSAVFLKENLHSTAFECTLGYVGFQFFVALGRWYSDYLVVSIGRKLLLQLSGVTAFCGLLLVVIAPIFMHNGGVRMNNQNLALTFSILGFSICGAGMSVVAPSVISLAGAGIKGMTPSASIALVTSIGYIGIMVGPPLLGGISVLVGGLRYSFLLVSVCLLCVTIVACFVVDIRENNNKNSRSSSKNTDIV